MGRARRRQQRRQTVRYLLDGAPREAVCGQAKAAARARAARTAPAPEGPPKGDRSVKEAARQLQAATGRPYGDCLAQIRAERAAPHQRDSEGGEP
jgi:hypothetical protein